MSIEIKMLINSITELFCNLEVELEEINKDIQLDISWALIDDIKGMLLELNEG